MVDSPYIFSIHNRNKLYFFESVGYRSVTKAVQFSFLSEGEYNLGLADVAGGRLDFQNLTDNGDSWKVFLTVAAIVVRFTEFYPSAAVVIRAFGEKRLHLYNRIFEHRRGQIETLFEVFGYLDFEKKIFEPFQSGVKYEAFLVRRKQK